jgi:hypothetical protein
MEDIGSLADRLNETLRLAGAGSAEQAFGLGCSIGLLPLLIVVGVLFVFKVVNLILAFILLIMGFLVIVGVSMLIAQRARTNGLLKTYQASVKPEITQYIAQNRLTRARFDTQVSQLLPQDAPLQAFLTQKEQDDNELTR